jgi:hypothetical protein
MSISGMASPLTFLDSMAGATHGGRLPENRHEALASSDAFGQLRPGTDLRLHTP